MLFNSVAFLAFFAVVFPLYCAFSFRWQNRLLLLASLVFYAWWDQAYQWGDIRHYRFVALMIGTAGLDYFVGNRIDASSDATVRKRWLVFSLVMNLGVLAFFKYCNFFIENAQAAMLAAGLQPTPLRLDIALPVAISFYTFQSMAYTIDIYRGDLKPAKSLANFLLFVCYFPHLVAGPINRPKGLLSQCEQPRRMTWRGWQEGALLILIGLFKKVAVADMLAPHVQLAFKDPAALSSGGLYFGLLCFSFQIYADFSGYTDIARGIAKLMGFELMENFQQPYLASNITDFWRRWHISLSTWLRDYLYLPLGGNRLGNGRTYINLFLVMFLGGLWHGASWNYAIWGTLHGVYLAAHKWLLRGDRPQETAPPSFGGRAAFLVKAFATFHLVAFAWIFFRAETFAGAMAYIRKLAAFSPAGTLQFDSDTISAGLAGMSVLLLIDLAQRLGREHAVFLRWPLVLRGVAFSALVVWLLMIRETDNVPFIYFQF